MVSNGTPSIQNLSMEDSSYSEFNRPSSSTSFANLILRYSRRSLRKKRLCIFLQVLLASCKRQTKWVLFSLQQTRGSSRWIPARSRQLPIAALLCVAVLVLVLFPFLSSGTRGVGAGSGTSVIQSSLLRHSLIAGRSSRISFSLLILFHFIW